MVATKSQPAHAITPPNDHPTSPKIGAAQLEDRGGHDAAQHAQAQHPAEDVDAASGDGVGDEYLHGVGEVQRDEVAEEDGHAEGGRLPVEGQRAGPGRCRGSTAADGRRAPGSTPGS